MARRTRWIASAVTVLVAAALGAALFTLHAPRTDAAVALKIKTTSHVQTALGTAVKATFALKSTRKAKVTITLYKGKKAVRKLSAKRTGLKYAASWNLRDSAGKLVSKGVYTYKVAAVAGSTTARTSSHITLPRVIPPRPAVKRWVGYYVSGNMATTANLDTIESQVGTRAVVVNLFMDDTDTFPTSRATTLYDRGSIPMVTLQFMSLKTGGLTAITNGSHDATIKKFADAAKSFGHTVWVRPFHEMNGNWYPWGATGSNTPAQLVAAWKHVHDIFVAEGATNVKFVWCVNSVNVPNKASNNVAAYWPGDAYVDYTAIDAYNFGTYNGGAWQSFSTVVGDSYKAVTGLSSKPLFLAETASVPDGGSKSAWITDEFSKIKSTYTHITGVCWFNVSSGEDWRIDCTPACLTAFKAGVASF